jgi:hypothetical protein
MVRGMTDDLQQAIADNAAVGAYLASLVPVPPPPQPVYLFDGRATTQGKLPTTTGTAPGTVTQTPPNPLPVWDGYLFQDSDIRVGPPPDNRWPLTYKIAPASGRKNPYNQAQPVGDTAAWINKVRPLKQGEVAWFANSFWLDSVSAWPPWGVLMSIGYQVILWGNVDLGPRASAGGQSNVWTITQAAGLVQNGRPAVVYTQPLKQVTLKAWADWIIGYNPSTGNDGWIEVHYRPGASGQWSQLWRKDGPTLEYTNPTGTPDPGTELNDKEGLYFGETTPAPTGVAYSRGLSRHPSLADALAALG